jgi:transcriptional regulator with XRE-family HTH domain
MENRLLALRKVLGMTQSDVAAATGISQAALSKIEVDGDRLRLTGQTLKQLAEGLGVSADYLLGLTDDPRRVREGPPITLREWAILEAVRRDDVKQVMRLMLDNDQ